MTPQHRVPHVEPIALPDRVCQQVRSNQSSQVRHYPVFASLNEKVVPECIEILANIRDLIADDAHQCEQGQPLLLVVNTILPRDAAVEALRKILCVVSAHWSAKPPSPGFTVSVP